MALDARNKARKVDRHGRPTTKDKEGDDEEEDDEET